MPTTASANGLQPKAFLRKQFGQAVEDLKPADTIVELNLSITDERPEDVDVEGSGLLIVSGQRYELSMVSGHLTRLTVNGTEALQGAVFSALPDGTELVLTISHLPGTSKTRIVGFFGALNAGSGILVFGEPFKEALEDIPEALEKGFERKNGPRQPSSGDGSIQASCGNPFHYNYGDPPNSIGPDYAGRRWQQIVDVCGWTVGAVMLWAPDDVTRGQSLKYGSRLWSDTFGATKGFESEYGFVKDVSVYVAELSITMPSVFQNSGHTSPLVGSSGSNIEVPLAELLNTAGCGWCWAIPNVVIPMKVTTAELKNVNGGTYNQFNVTWYDAFGFDPSDTDYVSSAEPYKDEKGFALMSPFSRQNALSGPTWYPLNTQGTLYYKARAAFGLVTYTVTGESFNWDQRNLP